MKPLDGPASSAIFVAMRILVLSDTHGNYPLALEAISMAGPVDAIVHLGDELEDARILETVLERTLLKVPGNCDMARGCEREIVATLGGVDFFITHGDRYYVKTGLDQICRKAVEKGVRAVLYGHTHRASVERVDDVLLVNPGSLGYNAPEPSFATISVDEGRVSAEIFTVNHA